MIVSCIHSMLRCLPDTAATRAFLTSRMQDDNYAVEVSRVLEIKAQ